WNNPLAAEPHAPDEAVALDEMMPERGGDMAEGEGEQQFAYETMGHEGRNLLETRQLPAAKNLRRSPGQGEHANARGNHDEDGDIEPEMNDLRQPGLGCAHAGLGRGMLVEQGPPENAEQRQYAD